jgi:hypothetical protein
MKEIPVFFCYLSPLNYQLSAMSYELPARSGLALKENLKFHPNTPVRNSDDFSGCHNRFLGFGKHKCQCYFLAGEQGPGGFNENAAGAHILNKCFEVGIHGLASGHHGLDFVESFPCIPPSLKIRYPLIL